MTQPVEKSKIDQDRVRAAKQRSTQKLKDEASALIQKTVKVRLINTYYKEAKARGFTILSDEPEEVGGYDKAPQPTEYMLASLAFCQASIYASYASTMRIPIDLLEITVKGYRDNRGLAGLADVRPGYYRIELETKINSSGGEEKVKKLAQIVEKKCPVYDNLSNPTPIANKVFLNDQEVFGSN
ncbi:MAG: OsmC family protein [Thaumarchaeota archaeon]|nr:OsmC family protein [Nitrososphaerota archaeon]